MSTFRQKVEQHDVIQFAAATALALQRNGPKLRPFVTEKPCVGIQAVAMNYFDKVEGIQQGGRKQDNLDIAASARRRWLLYNDPIKAGQYLDDEDMWQQGMDPTSALMQTHTAAVGRMIDAKIVDAFHGDAYEGRITPTAKPLPAAQKVGIQVGSGATPADTGLNPKKIRAGRKILGKNHIDLDREEVFLGVSEDEHDSLFDFVEASSADYQAWDASQRPVFRDGRLSRFLGCTMVRFEGWRTNANKTIRYLPMWTRQSIMLGVWKDVSTIADNDSSKQNQPWILLEAVMDARRMEDERVVEIACLIPS